MFRKSLYLSSLCVSAIILFGIVLPWMVSAKDDLLVAGALIFLIVYFNLAIVYFGGKLKSKVSESSINKTSDKETNP